MGVPSKDFFLGVEVENISRRMKKLYSCILSSETSRNRKKKKPNEKKSRNGVDIKIPSVRTRIHLKQCLVVRVVV